MGREAVGGLRLVFRRPERKLMHGISISLVGPYVSDGLRSSVWVGYRSCAVRVLQIKTNTDANVIFQGIDTRPRARQCQCQDHEEELHCNVFILSKSLVGFRSTGGLGSLRRVNVVGREVTTYDIALPGKMVLRHDSAKQKG